MGAQAEPEVQQHIPLSNSDRCLICYEQHTPVDTETGISFELRNLKDIFIRCFEIPFLPHFSKFGLVHMCTPCHEQFLKVEKLFDDVECTESSFDAAREKLAFIVVESVMKSGYISNYIHGNAFDAIRYLIFKAWCGKFKKQGQLKKNKPQKQIKKDIDDEEISESAKELADQTTVGEVEENSESKEPRGTESSTKESSNQVVTGLENETTKLGSESNKNSAEVSPVQTSTSTNEAEKETEKIEEKGTSVNDEEIVKDEHVEEKPDSEGTQNAMLANKASVNAKPVQESRVSEGTGEKEEQVSSSTDTSSVKLQVVETKSEDVKQTKSVGISSSNIGAIVANDVKSSAEAVKDDVKANKTTAEEPKVQSNPVEHKVIPATTQPAVPVKVNKQDDGNPTTTPQANLQTLSKSTFILSPDGQKLIPRSGVFSNTKLIFVKRDPVTGKMVRVAKPNLATVKGKLHGKEVIIHSAPAGAFQTVAKSDSIPFTKILPGSRIIPANSVAASPPLPKIISVQSMQSNQALNSESTASKSTSASAEASGATGQKLTLRSSDVADEKPLTGVKSPKVVEEPSPERRSARSGRRIKRPFESSAWASGHEMDKLVSQSLKDGRHMYYSPNKRQKAEARNSSSSYSVESGDGTDQLEDGEDESQG